MPLIPPARQGSLPFPAVALALACSWLLPLAALAQGPAGVYRASPRKIEVEISTWGEDCGARPKSYTDPDKPKVSVRMQGTHLSLSFPERTLRTDACWSENPTVRLASATATAERWRAECRTPEDEAKRERGVYTVTASSASTLELLEESFYNWQLNESRCVARMRVTQRLTRQGAESAEKPACTPGPLARIRLRPASARVAPGERLCFSVRGFDEKGCATQLAPESLRWSLDKPGGAKGTLAGGCFRAAASAAEGEGEFEVAVSRGGLSDEAAVVVATLDLSDITARRGSAGALDEDDEISEGGGAAFGIQAAVKRSPLGVKLAIGAALLSLVGLISFALLRRMRTLHAQRESRVSAPPRPPPSLRPRHAAPLEGPYLICPVCRQGYPPGTTRCPKDGGAPIPYADFLQQKQAEGPRSCPACGAKVIAGASFCGACGAPLGP